MKDNRNPTLLPTIHNMNLKALVLANAERSSALYAQGMRCGHIDGKPRCGIYVLGEEERVSLDAAEYQQLLKSEETFVWMKGYQAGYRLGAEGNALPDEVIAYPLPR